MTNISIDPQKRLFALQIGFCALAIVLLMQVGSRVAEPVMLSGRISNTPSYGPASTAAVQRSSASSLPAMRRIPARPAVKRVPVRILRSGAPRSR